MRRFIMVAVLAAGTALGVLAPAAGSTAAWADGPQHVKSAFTFENPQPPGAFCDFNYGEVATVSVDAIIFADGTETDHIAALVVHTNLDTRFLVDGGRPFHGLHRCGWPGQDCRDF